MADFCLQTTFFYANHQKMELHIVLRRSRDTVAALGGADSQVAITQGCQK